MSLDKTQALSIAKQYVLQHNVRAAIEIYREIIDADPTDLTAINTLGDLYASTGLVHDAVVQFSRVADSYIESGLTRKAIATLKKIIAAEPANIASAIKLADMYSQAGLPSEARQHYLQIVGFYSRNGETIEALRIFSKIVDLDPSNPSSRLKLGELYLGAGMNTQAYEAFVMAAEQLTNNGETRRALNAYKEALAIKPDSATLLAAVSKLTAALGSDQSKVKRSPDAQHVPSRNPADEHASTPSNQPNASTSLNLAPEGSDDLFVVQEISKAERLVAYGQVNKAISMLNDVLTSKPNHIDVHIKLKDIYLRTGMMAEAAHECNELARIYQVRGEHDRARDYVVRANRLTQLIERPSGDLALPNRTPAKAPEPRVSAAPIKFAPPREPRPKARQITGQLVAERPQPAPITLSVAPPVAVEVEPETIAAPAPVLATHQPEHSVPLSEPKLETEVAVESASDQPISPSTEVVARVLPSLSFGALPGERNRSRLTAATIAATVLALGLTGAVIGRFAYDAHLDKQYQALVLAAPPVVEQSPLPEPISETQPTEESEPNVVDVTAPLQTETPSLKETSPKETTAQLQKPEPELTRNEQPAPTQPASEPIKVPARSVPLPPRTAMTSDNQSLTENRTPAGLAGDVPVGASHPVEPPKPVRRSAGVVSGAAVKKVDPVYPKAAREALITGIVTVEVTINEQGNVTAARALSGPVVLRNAATAAARAWKFKPSMLGDVPVATTSSITFNFKL